jgi:hypothetical protein
MRRVTKRLVDKNVRVDRQKLDKVLGLVRELRNLGVHPWPTKSDETDCEKPKPSGNDRRMIRLQY